jgi:hypothetical protein
LASSLPADTQCYSFFVYEWWSHIKIAATDVSFAWLDVEDRSDAR